MKEVLKKLLILAQLDRQLLNCKKLREALPEDLARQAQICEAARSDSSEMESIIRMAMMNIDKINLEVNTAKDDIKKLNGKIGIIKNNKEYQIIAERIKDLETTIKRAEDRELVMIEELEIHKKAIKEKNAVMATTLQDLTALQQQVNEKIVAIKAQQKDLVEKRKAQIALCEQENPAAMNFYLHALQRGKGVACAQLLDGVCSECHRRASVNLSALVRINESIEKTVCGGCGRILYLVETA